MTGSKIKKDNSVRLNNKPLFWLGLTLVIIIAFRIFSITLYPLMDTTEARYAEIARLMFETQDWITPQFDYGIPFWGKPPLATWLSAISFTIFGVSEFSARLPSILLMMSMLGLVYLLGKKQQHAELGLASAIILASSSLFFISGGAVLMDTALAMGVTLSMVSFWLATSDEKKPFFGNVFGYTFFVGLAIGLLSKGPLTLVLVGFPVVLWTISQGNFRLVYKRMPWIYGSLLMIIITVPWYLLAELKTPGFLDYFLIGEHWKRFTISGWQGDLYGNAHVEPRGMIWWYTIVAFLPWSLLLPIFLWHSGTKTIKIITQISEWHLFLFLWAITPLLLFTFSGNILWTYTLPSMVPISILFAGMLANTSSEKDHLVKNKLVFFCLTFVIPLLLLLAITLQGAGYIKTKSQRDLVEDFHLRKLTTETFFIRDSMLKNSSKPSRLIYIVNRPFSAQFYSRGLALKAKNFQELEGYLIDDTIDFYAIPTNKLDSLPKTIRLRLREIGQYHAYSLLKEN